MKGPFKGISKFSVVLLLVALSIGLTAYYVLPAFAYSYTTTSNTVESGSSVAQLVFTVVNANGSHNISNITFQLPANFTFIEGTNGSNMTSAITFVTNNTANVTFSNLTAIGILNNETTNTSATFYFNVSTTAGNGTEAVTVFVLLDINASLGPSNGTVHNVNKNDSQAPVINETSPNTNGFTNDLTPLVSVILTDQNINISTNANGFGKGNVTFYWRKSGTGTYQRNVTTLCEGTAAVKLCNLTLNDMEWFADDGEVIQYFWNTTDTVSLLGTNGTETSPNSFTIDQTLPNNVINTTGSPIPDSNSSVGTPTFNVSWNDTNPNSCIVTLNNGTLTNFSMSRIGSGTGTHCTAALILPNDSIGISWSYFFFVNDSAGNSNISPTYNFTQDVVEAFQIGISTGAYSNGTYFNSTALGDGIDFNFTANESHINATSCTFQITHNGTAANYTGVPKSGGATLNCTYLFASPTDSIINTTFFVTDVAGNSNSSRLITYTIDTLVPNNLNASNGTPSAGTFANTNISVTSLKFNYTINETNPHSCLIEFNNGTVTNYTGILTNTSTGVGMSCLADLLPGNDSIGISWSAKLFFNDSAGNSNSTPLVNFTIDTSEPRQIDNSSGMANLNGSFTQNNYVSFNFTVNESHINATSCVVQIAHNGSLANYTAAFMGGGESLNCTYNFTNANDSILNATLWVTDVAGNQNSSKLITVTRDSTNATLNETSPVPGSLLGGLSNILFEVTVNEENIDPSSNVTVYYKPAGAGSYTSATLSCYEKASGVRIYDCNTTKDLSAILSDTEVLQFFFNMTDLGSLLANNGSEASPMTTTAEISAPGLLVTNVPTPTLDSNVTSTTVTFNYTYNETNPDVCVVEFNNGTVTNYSGTRSGSGLNTSCGITLTVQNNLLTNASWSHKVFVNDTAGNSNQSVLENFTVDSLVPNNIDISGGSLFNGTYINASYTGGPGVTFNFTVNESHINATSCLIEITHNGSAANYTAALEGGGSSLNCTYNFTTANEGIINATLWVTDVAGNQNKSQLITYIVDILEPNQLNQSNGTLGTSSNNSITSINFNYTINETNPDQCLIEFNNGTAVNYTGTLTRTATGAGMSCGIGLLAQNNIGTNASWSAKLFFNDSAENSNVTPFINFTIDTLVPNKIDNSSDTEELNGSYIIKDYITANFTVNETHVNATSCTFQFSNDSVANYTADYVGGDESLECNYNFTGLSDGIWNLTLFVTDVAGNSNSSKMLTVTRDTVVPTAIWNSTAVQNDSTLNGTYVFINYTINETNMNSTSCVVEFGNSSGLTNVTMTHTKYTLQNFSGCSVNLTAVSSGPVNYTFFVSDSAGNSNSSYQVFFALTDTTPPADVNLITPELNNSYTNVSYVFVNMSYTETNPFQCVFDWKNGTGSGNFTSDPDAGNKSCSYNFTSQPNIPINFTIYMNDSAGNIVMNTSRWYVTTDTVAPGLVTWNYSFMEKTLTFRFNETINTAAFNYDSVTITDNQSSFENGFNGFNVSANNPNTVIVAILNSTNTSVLVLNMTDAAHEKFEVLGVKTGCGSPYPGENGLLDMFAYGITDRAGNGVVGITNIGFANYSDWAIEFPQCGVLDTNANFSNRFEVISFTISASSVSGNKTVQNVLASIWGNFTAVHHYNTTAEGGSNTWKTFVPGRAVNDLTTISGSAFPYWINANVTDTIQIV
ncbi:MAG: hypothetical protein KKA90_03415 [Nanoarchaeota archaeon]|nr:hypothetical protein [Nanoarchaeota archaeon]